MEGKESAIKELLDLYNPHWFGERIGGGIKRERYLSLMERELEREHVTFLVGIRRVGKTTLLKQMVDLLIERGWEAERILYVSVDHPLLREVPIWDLVALYRKYMGVKGKVVLMLDEVVHGKDAFQHIKALHDTGRAKVFATSSSALSLQRGSGFVTGRHRVIRVKPLSFSEFLHFTGKGPSRKSLDEYLLYGGIPHYVLHREPSYLAGLVEDIIVKDVAERFNVKGRVKLKELFLLLLARIGKPTTYAKLAKLLRLKEETVENYISYFQEAELVHVVYRYSKSWNEKIYSPKKFYVADVGLRYALTGKAPTGSNFENAVFLQIMEREPHYYLEGGVEIDFLTKDRFAYECKLREEVSVEQAAVLEKLKRRGWRVELLRDYGDLLKLEEEGEREEV